MRRAPIFGLSSTDKCVIAAAVFIACVFIWLTSESVGGFLTFDDEHYTAERSREMVLMGPWAVHDNFVVTAAKPPLQYWLNALLLPHLTNGLLALRLWPLLLGMAAAAATAALACLLDPMRPWLMPASVLLLLSCPLFLKNARSATLDSGLIFYTTLFLVSSYLARTSPRWWVAAGFSCWLGSLQKAPVILLVWIIILALRFFDHEGRATLRNRWLLTVLPVTLVFMALWPLSQILIFRLSPADVLRIHEPFAIAARRAGAPLLDAPYRLITAWPCGGFAILAAMFTPIIAKGAPRAAAIELASLCLIAIGLSVISNTREVNYLGPIIPSLCVLLALSLRWLLERRRKIGIALSIMIGALAISGWPVMHVWMERTQYQQWKRSGARDLADHAQIAQQLATSQNGNRRRVVVEADNHMLPQDFYLFYGQLDSPLTNLTLDQLQQQRPASPFVAISTKQDMKAAEKLLGHLHLQRSFGEVACWEAD